MSKTFLDGDKIQTEIKQSKRGGKRVGAGRPPSGAKPIAVQVTEAKQLAIQSVVQQFRAELEERLLKNVRNLGRLADGLTKEEVEAFGALPDRYANIYLIDRLVGKPVDPETPKAITVRVIYEDEKGKGGVEVKVG